MTWYGAAGYCNWLSKQEGLPEDEWCYAPDERGQYIHGMKMMSNWEARTGFRLPTAVEWEYACRAGAVTTYSFGEPRELLEQYAWYTKNSPARSNPVGTKKPNDLGLFDLHGNLYEWCQDRFDPHNPSDRKIGKVPDYVYMPDILDAGAPAYPSRWGVLLPRVEPHLGAPNR